jgi:hypothetical protein
MFKYILVDIYANYIITSSNDSFQINKLYLEYTEKYPEIIFQVFRIQLLYSKKLKLSD